MEGVAEIPRKRLLDPVARISEVLFGLIMALTFTGTLGVATAEDEDVRTLLIGAIGCNIAWGLVDSVMFLIATLTERGRNLVTVRNVLAASPEQAHGIIASSLPPMLASLLARQDLEHLRRGLLAMRPLPNRPFLDKDDWWAALGVFLLVVLSTFPIVIPFLLFSEVYTALRASNLVAIVMLFAAGYLLARYAGYRPWVTGATMVVLGVTLVGIAIALGG
jgi:VIT1/CCC1 family predicted Fe2+/Mn2+ transporter